MDKYIRQDRAAIASSESGTKTDNPFVSSNRTDIDSLATALDALQILTSRTHRSMTIVCHDNPIEFRQLLLIKMCTISVIVVVVSVD
jgi:hypothetical protein